MCIFECSGCNPLLGKIACLWKLFLQNVNLVQPNKLPSRAGDRIPLLGPSFFTHRAYRSLILKWLKILSVPPGGKSDSLSPHADNKIWTQREANDKRPDLVLVCRRKGWNSMSLYEMLEFEKDGPLPLFSMRRLVHLNKKQDQKSSPWVGGEKKKGFLQTYCSFCGDCRVQYLIYFPTSCVMKCWA